MVVSDPRSGVRHLRPIPPGRAARHNLPLTPTPLLGRDADIATIELLLARQEVRLLTLTGPAGVGKTRLALAVAEGIRGTLPHDLWFIDCATVAGAEALLRLLSDTLAVLKARGRDLRQRLTQALSTHPTVLLLDHLDRVDGAATLVAELLATCPTLIILTTGQAALLVRWEHRYNVASLAYPTTADWQRPDRPEEPIPAALALFVARARAVCPHFTLTPANITAVASLCARLEGMPLAIELVAAHAHLFSPHALLAQPTAWLLDLHWNAADLPTRHRTIGAAIAWSCEQLPAEERAFLYRLGVFADGMSVEAVTAVIESALDATPTLAQLCALAERNLLLAYDPTADTPRFKLSGLGREYALAQLAVSGEREELARRHAEYFVTLAERADIGMLGPGRGRWVRLLDLEIANCRAALNWAVANEEAAIELRLAAALGHFWWTRGLLDEGRSYLERALTRPSDAPATIRAKALTEYTIPLMWQGEYIRAKQCSAEALALARPSGDRRRVAEALVYLGWLADATGEADPTPYYEEALSEADIAQDPWVGGLVLMNFGALKLRQGKSALAAKYLDDGLARCRQAGDIRLVAVILSSLARVAREHGDYSGALALLTEALSFCRESGDLRATYFAAATAATLLVTRGDAQHALPLLTALDRGDEGESEPRLSPAEHTPRRAFTATRRAFAASPIAAMWSAGAGHPIHQLLDGVVDALSGVPVTARTSSTSLSEREREVLRLIAAGLPNKQIAQMLTRSERTVKAHLTTAMGKLGADNRAQAAVLAIQQQLL